LAKKLNKSVIVVGGGIVGLATAMQILEQLPGVDLKLFEKEKEIAQHQTGRNSGVIHSGLYYKPGSLKALNCIAGYQSMIEFCERYAIPFEITGKLVIATSEKEIPRLNALFDRGLANGLTGIRYLKPKAIQEYEPFCVGVQGLWVPQTGIVNYTEVAKKLAQLVVDMGGEILFNQEVGEIRHVRSNAEVITGSDKWLADAVVVCAGLQSDRLTQNSKQDMPLRVLPFRGEYYEFTASAPKLVNNLIYPVPNPSFPFLGVHFTRGIDNVIECGPNAVFSLGRESYKKSKFKMQDLWDSVAWPGTHKLVSKYWRMGLGEAYRSISKLAFVRELQKLVPEVEARFLEIGNVGIRAQAIDRKGNLLDDFEIFQDGRLIHVWNAPSPAATASLAIGSKISKMVLEILR
jgi:L-2-hydroxyglutarate oxidase